MHETMMKLRILARAEMTLARTHLQRAANRAILYAIAIGLILLAVVMVNIGAYQLLSETYGNALAAFLVAAGNGVIAIILAIVASRIRPGAEEQMVHEIRDMALAEVTADIDEMKSDFAELGADVRRIRRGFSSLGSSGGFGAGLFGFAPLISMIIEAVKQRRKDRGTGSSSA